MIIIVIKKLIIVLIIHKPSLPSSPQTSSPPRLPVGAVPRCPLSPLPLPLFGAPAPRPLATPTSPLRCPPSLSLLLHVVAQPSSTLSPVAPPPSLSPKFLSCSRRKKQSLIMDLSHSSSGDHGDNFVFAFNSSNFSDCMLRIEIMEGAAESKSDGGGCSSIANWARYRKRRREDIKKEQASEFDAYNSDNIVNCDQPDVDDAVAYESHDGEADAMIESPTDSSSGEHLHIFLLMVHSGYYNGLVSFSIRQRILMHHQTRGENKPDS